MAKETRKPISREKAEKIVGGQGEEAPCCVDECGSHGCLCICPTIHCGCTGHRHQ